jgi:hypothetical protein
MKNANRNTLLAATAALALAVAPSALADVRIHVNLPLPPPPHKVLRHLPAPPPPPVVDFGYRDGDRDRYDRDGRGYYGSRYGDDRRYRDNDRWAYVEGRWVKRPFRGAVWVDGYHDRWGRWVPGYWARARYR